jgi:hypothetical protein
MPDLTILLAPGTEKRMYLFKALRRRFAGNACITGHYSRSSGILAAWGMGDEQRKAMAQHQGPVLIFDYGFWGSTDADPFVRLSNLTPKVLPPASGERFDGLGVKITSEGRRDGPIVIVGLGRKTRHRYGLQGAQWELSALRRVRAKFPGRRVLYRPKQTADSLPGCETMSKGAIEDVIRDAALVVCKHSNVAVDAAVMGVAAACESGPGAYLWGNDLSLDVPSVEERLEFCRRLAWWQWRISEIEKGKCWPWILKHL